MTEEKPERKSIDEQLDDEYDAVLNNAEKTQDLVEPTEEEKRNGWTAETLTEYLAERKAGQSLAMDPNSLHSRMASDCRAYNPHKFRS